MRNRNDVAGHPSLLPASACFLALAFFGFGCGGAEPPVREPIAREQKTAQDAPHPTQALKRTPSTVPSPRPAPESPHHAMPVSLPAPEPQPELEPPLLSRATVLSDIGEMAYRQEDYKFAEKNFREALVLEPGLLHALTGLGWALYDSDRSQEAFFYFGRARTLYPESGSARRGYAYLLYRYGRMKEAKALLGSLDKARWPELANIDDELKARAIKGLPAPRVPADKSEDPQEEPSAEPASSGPEPQEPSTESEPQRKAEPESTPKPEPETKTAKLTPPELVPEKLRPPPPVRKPSLEGMVNIPGGRFKMGMEFPRSRRSRGRRRRRRAPLRGTGGRPVGVESFRLDKLEVTNSLYADFVRATSGSAPPFWRKAHFIGPHLPVVGVTWGEARAYCEWAGKRLPTEAEWEYAAQGAGKGRRYPWGNTQRDRNAVFGLSPDAGGPKTVGRRPGGASIHGVEDLAGNVWEWVEDEFRTKPEDALPINRNGRALRTLKGGSWVNGWWALTSSNRTGDAPDRRLPAYGFRCAADAPE